MTAKRSITFPIFATDKASPTMRGVGRNAASMGDQFKKVGAAIGVGLAVAGAAAIKFGVDSVQAFAQAQESQNRLQFALEKFPALADTNIEALRELNSALQRKTRFDDDAIASGQSVLATFGLTGQQLRRLTPLLLDYAARTGKDLTTASEDLGRALLGQGRALKAIGLDLTDAGDLTANFDQLVAGLSDTVGGFAEQDAQTAAGKLDQLKNRFGDVQEIIGEALMPALDQLMDWFDGEGMAAVEGFGTWLSDEAIPNLSDFVGWIIKYKDILGPATVALGTLTAAQWALNAAMLANPVGLVIAGLTALVAFGTAVATNFMGLQNTIIGITFHIQKAFMGIAIGFAGFIEGMINMLIDGLNTVLGFFGLGGVGKVDLTSALEANWIQTSNNLLRGMAGGFDALLNPTAPSKPPTGIGAGGRIAMAEGGIVRPTPTGTNAIIGEAGYPEAVIPLTRTALAEYGLGGGGGDTYILQVPQGSFIGSREEFARWATRALEDARKNGVIRRSARA